MTDSQGNVIVTSDAVSNTLVTKYTPGGQRVYQRSFGGFLSIEAIGRLAVDPGTGIAVSLFPNGEVYTMDPNVGQQQFAFNIRALQVDNLNIYDVSTGTFGPMAGLILPALSTYGDIAVLRRGTQVELFVTGLSVTFPFVMRINLNSGVAKVVAASRASIAQTQAPYVFDHPNGIAVNAAGTVLTTLPFQTQNGNYYRAFAFSADIRPEDPATWPRVLFNGADVSSRGMASDASGNFYIATGSIGASSCGTNGSGTMLTVPSSLQSFVCHNLGPGLFYSRDVAASPDGRTAYMTVLNHSVVSFSITPSTQCSYSLAPTSRTVDAAATSGSITVTASAGCGWQAASGVNWITITANAAGTGNGTVSYSVAANSASASRVGSITIADKTFTITQSGSSASQCVHTLTPANRTVDAPATNGSIAVTAGAGCSWQAASGVNWITITANAAGTGNGTVNYSVAANSSASSRTGTVTITGHTFTITQLGLGSTSGSRFVPVTPCRVADTRVGQGKTGAFGPPTLNGGQTREIPVPQSTCGIPATARAYSVNMTVVPAGPLAYLTVWPTGQMQPLVSTLNSFEGSIVANAAIVPAGVNGSIDVFVTNRTDVIIDINGYFAP